MVDLRTIRSLIIDIGVRSIRSYSPFLHRDEMCLNEMLNV